MPEDSLNSLPKKNLVVLVDPYSTGCLIAQEMMRRGCAVMALWTIGFSDEMKTHIPLSCSGIKYYAEADEQDTMEATVAMVRETAGSGHNVVACLAGGEAGVDCADALSEALQLVTNGTDIANRRDKKLQQELVKAAGMRSVRQGGGGVFEGEVRHFLETEDFPVVLKPTESAGSDGVKLCHTFEEAKEHFELLMDSQMVNGGECPAVLCQEFLRGKEYVVDHVSLDGIHKTTMVWVYDKRPANGSAFVYFGCVPVDVNSPEAKILIPYVRGVLDAIGVRNGPSHGEVMMTVDGPCLVEMNCRAHGGDGNWRPLCRALTGGYSQVEATVDAYLEPADFHKLPDKPPSPFKAAGQEVIMVSYSKGKVISTPGYEVIKCLPSFLVLESGIQKGSEVDFTIDLVTCIGSVILMHPDAATLQKDIDFIRHMEKVNGVFTYETKLANLKRPRGDSVGGFSHRRDFSADGPMLIRHMSNDRPELRGGMMLKRGMTTTDASKEIVVLVDPYSTGCCVAQEIKKRGYSIMALWTRGFVEEMKQHIPLSCEGLTYHEELDEADTMEETIQRVKDAAGSKRVVSVLAGGEAGVIFADALSEAMTLRTNGTEVANRCDKRIQQELIKAAGFRSVRQSGGTEFHQVEKFLDTESFPVVLKPNESAGSDGVKLCHNFEEAKDHFNILMKSQMVNGGDCPAVLCQEFLRGKEYVVDHVSRDGIHKTTMVWVYDKRPVNGAQFVYFGCVPVDPQSPEARILIPYVRGVLDALGVMNGPSHGEVMMTADGPCLVEMNCRAHGGDGNWRPLCLGLTGGYSQVEATVDAYLEKKSFFDLPDKPPSPFKAAGQEVILVSFSKGTVKATPGFDAIQGLQSFVYLETGVKKGSKVEHTVDLFTCIGSAILMHEDKEILEKDVNFIRQLEEKNELFEYEQAPNVLHSMSKMNLKDGVAGNKNMEAQHRRVFSSDRNDMF
jgi:biotin carboxylase